MDILKFRWIIAPLVVLATLFGPKVPTEAAVCSGVNVTAGSNLSTVAASHPAGTTFCLAVGDYDITSSVQAQQGDVFWGVGRNSTFVEGNGTTQHLFTSSGGDDFEVRNLDISGAVGDSSCAPNCGRAFRATGVVTLRNIRCHDNDNQCAGGGGGGVVMLGSECDNNGWNPAFNTNPDGPANTRSAACIKKASTGVEVVEVRNSHIHHNGWVGVWCDFCQTNTRFIVTASTIVDNASKGVSYEVSGGYGTDFGRIKNNVIQRNGLGDQRTVSAGITCNSCADLTIEGNTFGGNANGKAVGLVNGKRGPWGDLKNIIIRNNILNGDTVPCGMVGVTCSGNA